MLAAMPATVWREWMGFFRLEPFGPVQDDLRVGILASLLHNAWFDGPKIQPHEVFPSIDEAEDPEDDPLVQQAMAKAFVLASGGKVE